MPDDTLSMLHGSLSLFAEAIAGHGVALEAVAEGTVCWPACPADHSSDVVVLDVAADRPTYRATILHQLVGNEATEQIAYQPGPEVDESLFTAIAAIVEDLRVDALTRRRYPGARRDLNAVLNQALDRERASRIAPGDSTRIDAIELLRWRSLGADHSTLRQYFAELDPKLVDAAVSELERVETAGTSRHDSLLVAERLANLLALDGSRLDEWIEASPELDDEAPGVPADERDTGSLDAHGTPTDVEESEDAAGGQPAGDLPPSDSASQDTADHDKRTKLTAGLQLPHVASSHPTGRQLRTYLYDEWDFRAGRHRPAWCRLTEEPLHGEDHNFINDVRARHRQLRMRIRRSFARLRPTQLVRVYRSHDGEEVDIDAVIEAIADRRSGAAADDRLHVRRDRAARDVATAFLIDLSASTSSPAIPLEPEPVPDNYDPLDDPMSYGPIWGAAPEREPVRRVIDVAKDAVALMSDALHELGDQHAVYGFSGTGRDGVEFTISKDFGDRVCASTWAAIAEMKPLRYTRMGPAIRHTTSKLAAQSARTKLMVLISDGYPQDVDYGEDRRDKEYGLQDTARALRDAAQTGIDTFCVTIDPAGHDYLRKMCPDNRYLVIDDVEALPEELAKLYLALAHQ